MSEKFTKETVQKELNVILSACDSIDQMVTLIKNHPNGSGLVPNETVGKYLDTIGEKVGVINEIIQQSAYNLFTCLKHLDVLPKGD